MRVFEGGNVKTFLIKYFQFLFIFYKLIVIVLEMRGCDSHKDFAFGSYVYSYIEIFRFIRTR